MDTGAFGIVYEAEHRATGDKRACKCIAKAKLVSQEDVEDVQREVQVLQMVGQHENVAELLGVYEDQRNVYLVLELCKGGELFDRIVSKGTFSEKMVGAMVPPSPAGVLVMLLAMCPTSIHQLSSSRACSCRLPVPAGIAIGRHARTQQPHHTTSTNYDIKNNIVAIQVQHSGCKVMLGHIASPG